MLLSLAASSERESPDWDKDLLSFGSPNILIQGLVVVEESGNERTIYSLEELELSMKYFLPSLGIHIQRLNSTQISVKKESNPLGIPNNLRQSKPINISASPSRASFHEPSSPFVMMSPMKPSYMANQFTRSGSSSGSSPYSTNFSPGSRVGSLSDEFFEHVSFRTAVHREFSQTSIGSSEFVVEILVPLKFGERLEKIVEDVILSDSNKENNKVGCLYLTNFQVIFIPAQQDSSNTQSEQFFQMDHDDMPHGEVENGNRNPPFIDSVLRIPYAAIARFEKIDTGHFMFQNSVQSMEIIRKDFRWSTRFGFDQSKHSRNEICHVLSKHVFPNDEFQICRKSLDDTSENDGWNIFNVKEEFERMNVNLSIPNSEWRLCTINENYQFCPTYSKHFVVPASITDEELKISSMFRSKARIPILSWIDVNTGASITRSSQPKIGLKMNRCKEDEKVLKAIKELNSNCEKLCVLDARPSTNALANVAIGGGSENHGAYFEFCNVEFLNIPNIHYVRDSWNRLRDLCETHCVQSVGTETKNTMSNTWLSQLESTHWLDHVSTILCGACKVLKLITSKKSVLLHCTDGWDRTPQVSSLAQILLDPYYRTIRGFCILIEKEWLSMGHKFGERLGLNGDENQKAPILPQFLDCVWQVLNQFPQTFEFTEDLLLTISEHLYSGEFGTFLMNCEKDRVEKQLSLKTKSLWSFILSHANEYLNPFYLPFRGSVVLDPATDVKNLLFWKSNYMRYLRDTEFFDYQQIYTSLGKELKNKINELTERVRALENENERLKKEKNSGNDSETSSSQNGTEANGKKSNGTEAKNSMSMRRSIGRIQCHEWEDYNGPSISSVSS